MSYWICNVQPKMTSLHYHSVAGIAVFATLMFSIMRHSGFDEQHWTAQEWGAFIAILALRANTSPALADDLRPIRINGTTVENDSHAVQVISQLPKPLACSAAVSGAFLSLTCETITDPVLIQARRAKATRFMEEYPDRDPEPALALDVAGERHIIPAAAIEIFLADYSLNYALAFDDPDPEAKQLGAVGIVQVRRFGNVKMFGTSPDVRWVFNEPRDVEL